MPSYKHALSVHGQETAAIAGSEAFKSLLHLRTRFVMLALTAAIVWFGLFVLLTAYAHDFMSIILVPGLSVAYVLGFSQFLLVWVLTALYLRTSNRTFIPLQERALLAVAQVSETEQP
jgi:uncharacterized membrane protein (DUF485 family)